MVAESGNGTMETRRGDAGGAVSRRRARETRRRRGNATNQITTRLPDDLAGELNAMAARLERSRADIVRHAIERYLDDLDDLEAAAERLRDPDDPALDWDRARRSCSIWTSRAPLARTDIACRPRDAAAENAG